MFLYRHTWPHFPISPKLSPSAKNVCTKPFNRPCWADHQMTKHFFSSNVRIVCEGFNFRLLANKFDWNQKEVSRVIFLFCCQTLILISPKNLKKRIGGLRVGFQPRSSSPRALVYHPYQRKPRELAASENCNRPQGANEKRLCSTRSHSVVDQRWYKTKWLKTQIELTTRKLWNSDTKKFNEKMALHGIMYDIPRWTIPNPAGSWLQPIRAVAQRKPISHTA